jgi:hypothetical protein
MRYKSIYNLYPHEQKLAAFQFLLTRMHRLPLTPLHKYKEWTTILRIAQVNGFPHTTLKKLNKHILQKLNMPHTANAQTTTQKHGLLLHTTAL